VLIQRKDEAVAAAIPATMPDTDRIVLVEEPSEILL
jgi:hypothetical protein